MTGRTPSYRRPFPALAALALALVVVTAAERAPAQDVTVQARKTDAGYVVDAAFTVPASVDIAWDVLTDFDGMGGFISSVEASRIVNRSGNTFEVDQQGRGSLGPLRFTFTNVRRVELMPRSEIVSTLVRSDNLKSSDFTTRLAPQGQGTAVTVQGAFTPTWFASTVLTVDEVRARVGRLYAEMRSEMVRRARGEARPACLATRTCP